MCQCQLSCSFKFGGEKKTKGYCSYFCMSNDTIKTLNLIVDMCFNLKLISNT